jgi:hypothetical protein
MRTKAFLKPKFLLFIVLIFVACNPIRGCVESNFTLTEDSRLPKWFQLPAGYSRTDVIVELFYYIPPGSLVDDTVLELVGRNGQVLAEVTGKHCWHPDIDRLKRNKWGGFDPDSEEPRYVIVRVNGIMEVIDHPGGPIFRVTDNPVLVKQAIDSLQRGECRKE